MDDYTKAQSTPQENGARPFFLVSDNLKEASSQGLAPTFRRFCAFLGLPANELFELQALQVRGVKAPIHRGGNGFAHIRSIQDAVSLLGEAEEFNAQGLYLLPNRVNPDIGGRGTIGCWNEAHKGASTTDRDITHRRMMLVDCDAVRPSGVSATEVQMQASFTRALQVAKTLTGLLGDERAIGLGMSGGGGHVYMALDDIPESKETEDLIKGILGALGRTFSDQSVKVDEVVYDAKRLVPAFGTWKRKGSHSAHQPHRRTWFTCHQEPRRLSSEELHALAEKLGGMPSEPGVPHQRSSASMPVPAVEHGIFAQLKALPIREVASALGLDPNHPQCPMCQATEGVDYLDHKGIQVLKCLHASCGRKGYDNPALIAKIAFNLDTLKSNFEGVRRVQQWAHDHMGTPAPTPPGRKPRREPSRLPAPLASLLPGSPNEPVVSTAAVEDWRNRLQTDANGRLRSTFTNAWLLLKHDPAWDGVLVYDEFSSTILFTRCPPWVPGTESAIPVTSGTPWSDTDEDRLVAYVASLDIQITQQQAYRLAVVLADAHHVHQVRDYLSTLTHDGQPRLEGWLHRYLGSVDSPYTRAAGCRWMIQAVARAMNPGCKADYVLVLEGPQGRRKSTALKTLCPQGAWFSDTPFDIGNKDAFLALRGKFVVEIAELDAVMRAESSGAKAFFTSGTDSYRPPYGRQSKDVPRHCVFAGTINPEGEYLRDATGGRRYWPVPVGTLDLEALAADRDQLWAEAKVLYEQGQLHWATEEEQESLFAPEQASRQERDAWHDQVEQGLRRYNETTLSWLMEHLLGLSTRDRDNRAQGRVRRILLTLGFDPPSGTTTRGGRSVRLFRRRELVSDAYPFDPSKSAEYHQDTNDGSDALSAWLGEELAVREATPLQSDAVQSCPLDHLDLEDDKKAAQEAMALVEKYGSN